MTSRDVIIVNDLYCMQNDLSIYNLLLDEIKSCGIPDDQLFKLWHGNQEIEGTHMIADDKTHWKTKCPTFKMVLDKATSFFGTRGSIFDQALSFIKLKLTKVVEIIQATKSENVWKYIDPLLQTWKSKQRASTCIVTQMIGNHFIMIPPLSKLIKVRFK